MARPVKTTGDPLADAFNLRASLLARRNSLSEQTKANEEALRIASHDLASKLDTLRETILIDVD